MAQLEKKSFNSPDETRKFVDKGKADVIQIAGRSVLRGTFEPGWKWSQHLKPIVGGDSCQTSHIGYVVSGRMRVFMDDGSQGEAGPNEVVAIPPGHDAEVVGNESCVFLDFGEVAQYASPR
ncbi:MAG: cupin [Dehalococcoidia bacterium]|nr:cupin [Dehalococcoidia bacterium]